MRTESFIKKKRLEEPRRQQLAALAAREKTPNE